MKHISKTEEHYINYLINQRLSIIFKKKKYNDLIRIAWNVGSCVWHTKSVNSFLFLLFIFSWFSLLSLNHIILLFTKGICNKRRYENRLISNVNEHLTICLFMKHDVKALYLFFVDKAVECVVHCETE